MLQRIRELAVEYQGGTLDTADQNAIVSEVQQLVCQIDQIGTQAQFNGISLFDPSGTQAVCSQNLTLDNGVTVNIATTSLTFQVGANDGEVISITLQSLVGPSGILSLAGLRHVRYRRQLVHSRVQPRHLRHSGDHQRHDRRGLDAGVRRSARSRTV